MASGARKTWLGALPWALLILFVLRGLAAARGDSATIDEPLHLGYGERALKSGTFFRDDDRLNSKMPVSVLNALPVTLADRDGTWNAPRRLFLARLPTLLLGALLGGLVWSWARALFGDWSGLLALFLYTFCPNVLAHSHLVTTDVPTSLAMFAAAYAFWRCLERPGRGRLLMAAAAFGAAQLTKTTAAFLAPIFALILGLRLCRDLVRERRARAATPADLARFAARRAARDAGLLLALGLGALVAVNAGFGFEGTGTPLKSYSFVSQGFRSLAAKPVLRDVPLPLPYAYVQGLDMVSRDARENLWCYLRGQYSETGFPSYFFWAFLVKVPVATQLLLLLALGLWGAGRLRAPGAEDFLVVPVIFQLAYFSLFFHLDIGLRYILPVFPFLFVFASRVAAAGSSVETPAKAPRWRLAVVGLLSLWLAVASFSIHPHYLAYFNEVAGGPDNGGRWLIDSNLDWGQDDDYVRNVYARHSPVPLIYNPDGPIAGRIAVDLTDFIGANPEDAQHHAWLRDNFKPIARIRHTWEIFDVTEADLARCCAGMPRAMNVDDPEVNVALLGNPIAGGDHVRVRFADQLNDGTLGTNDKNDATRTVPARPQPVRAWFGIDWFPAQKVGRVVAFPSFNSRGPEARKFLALDYVFQFWDGKRWRDIPGTRVVGNQALRVEHRFPPLSTRGLRLLIERERNEQGEESSEGAFRAACLEIAAYEK